jgi:NADPH2:quinone reductase
MRRVEVAAYGAEEVLRPAEFEPSEPGPRDVEIELQAAGVNPADTYLRGGGYEFIDPGLPFAPGFDGAGVVSRVGSAVDALTVGDRVWVCTIPARTVGTYAETLVCDSGVARPLPDSVGFDAGAAIGVPYITAYRALVQRGGARPGETVLVHGASGGVGIATVQVARALGLHVIGTAGTAGGRDLVLSNGARHVLDHRIPGHLDVLRELTDGRGIDLVIEMVAGANLGDDIDALARGGRIVIVGSRGPVEILPRGLMVAEADIRGTALWNMSPSDFAEAFDAIGAWLAAGAIAPVVGRVLPLAEAAEAHRLIVSGSAGKIVLRTR